MHWVVWGAGMELEGVSREFVNNSSYIIGIIHSMQSNNGSIVLGLDTQLDGWMVGWLDG